MWVINPWKVGTTGLPVFQYNRGSDGRFGALFSGGAARSSVPQPKQLLDGWRWLGGAHMTLCPGGGYDHVTIPLDPGHWSGVKGELASSRLNKWAQTRSTRVLRLEIGRWTSREGCN